MLSASSYRGGFGARYGAVDPGMRCSVSRFESAFEVLGIPRSATDADVEGAWQRHLLSVGGLVDHMPGEVLAAYDLLKGAKVGTYRTVLSACENCDRIRLGSADDLAALRNLCADAGFQVFQEYSNPLTVEVRYPGQRPPSRAPRPVLPAVHLPPTRRERTLGALAFLATFGPVRKGPVLVRLTALLLYFAVPGGTGYWGIEQAKALVTEARSRSHLREVGALKSDAVAAQRTINDLQMAERLFADRFGALTGVSLDNPDMRSIGPLLSTCLLKHREVRETWANLLNSRNALSGLDRVASDVARAIADDSNPSLGRAILSTKISAAEQRLEILTSMHRDLDLIQFTLDAERFDRAASRPIGDPACVITTVSSR
jgi:hypothetical protein